MQSDKESTSWTHVDENSDQSRLPTFSAVLGLECTSSNVTIRNLFTRIDEPSLAQSLPADPAELAAAAIGMTVAVCRKRSSAQRVSDDDVEETSVNFHDEWMRRLALRVA